MTDKFACLGFFSPLSCSAHEANDGKVNKFVTRSTANSLLLSPEDARRTLTPAKRSHLCWPQSIVTVEGRLQCNMTETEQDLFTRISSSEVSVNTLCTEYQPLAIANHNSNPSLASRGECGSSRRRAGKVEENCGESCLTALYRTILTAPVLILPKLDAGFNSCSSSSDLKMDGERKPTGPRYGRARRH